MRGWKLRLFGRELVSLEVTRDDDDATADVHETPGMPTACGGGAGHNFDRRGEVDFEAPMFGFHTTRTTA